MRRLRWYHIPLALVALILVAILAQTLHVMLALRASAPRLEGQIAAQVSAPVSVARDAEGVPTLTAGSQADLAYAIGYLHAQERFFQMDQLRRVGAGELSELLGPPTLDIDRKLRVHRFRDRARAELGRMTPWERAVLDAYVAGVNSGLRALGSAPFEYAALLAKPEPWLAEDSLLTAYAMYFDLQGVAPTDELKMAAAERKLGAAMTEFLFPAGTALDSAIDGSLLPEPPMPESIQSSRAGPAVQAPLQDPAEAPNGSNAWAVDGSLSSSGAALVANDMHLGLSTPGIWYRARMIAPAEAGLPALDITGVTLPGAPFMVAGSNGHIAWGFTNSYIDTSDAVLLEEGPNDTYKTPRGPKPIQTLKLEICARIFCKPLLLKETLWGPVIADEDGRKVAMRWSAHDAGAVTPGGILRLMRAGSVDAALALAHQIGMPQQNFIVGDSSGAIAWTIIGRVPARFGMDGRRPSSWADGSRGWRGTLPPDQVPVVRQARIWTANNRTVGGDAYARLGYGGYDNGARAERIRKRLFQKNGDFTPKDMLSIQLDVRNDRNRFWQAQMLAALPKDSALRAPVENWQGQADPASVGFRLVNTFRSRTIALIYNAYLGEQEDKSNRSGASNQAEGPVRRLLTERPAGLVPPGYADWPAVLAAALRKVDEDVEKAAGGDVTRYTWGAVNKPQVNHPLSAILPPIGWLTDPKPVAVPGSGGTPRVDSPQHGASERFSVSPGHEADGLFQMPGGQSGYPWSPYYLAGHKDWLMGNPRPFLPGAPKWRLEFRPTTRTAD